MFCNYKFKISEIKKEVKGTDHFNINTIDEGKEKEQTYPNHKKSQWAEDKHDFEFDVQKSYYSVDESLGDDDEPSSRYQTDQVTN